MKRAPSGRFNGTFRSSKRIVREAATAAGGPDGGEPDGQEEEEQRPAEPTSAEPAKVRGKLVAGS